MSKLKTMIMALIMLISILSGCTSSDISSDVTDLKSIDLYLTQRVALAPTD